MTLVEFLERYPHDPKKPFCRGWKSALFTAVDQLSGERVAIKRGRASNLTNRFSIMEEFKLGQQLHHPNIIKYYDVYRMSVKHVVFDFGVMEFVENGTNFGDYLASKPNFVDFLEVFKQILYALKYIHGKNIVHCDINPKNILIKYENGQAIPKIIDFEISGHLSFFPFYPPVEIGTTEYMSPEQLSGQWRIKSNTDLWAIGVLLYRVFTGKLPFGSLEHGDSEELIKSQILSYPPPEGSTGIPQPFDLIVESCLKKDVGERIGSVDEILRLLA